MTLYISKCGDDVVITKTIKSFPNQKAWMNGEVRALSRAKKAAFQSGDKEAYNTTRARLKAGCQGGKAETSGETGERPQHQQHQRQVAGDPEDHRLQEQEHPHHV